MARVEVPGFSDRIKKAIEESGMSMRELEVETGIPNPDICRYKNGKIYPGIGNLAILCETLNVSADYLLFGKESRVRSKETK